MHFEKVRAGAARWGFDAVGCAPAGRVSAEHEAHLRAYLHQGHHADMTWMENHLEKRLDPRRLWSEARTVIALLRSYAPAQGQTVNPHIALYAQGEDYHKVMKEKMKHLAEETLPPGSFRCFCDTAPLLEKYWAATCGLGFIGKNTLLIHPVFGSCCFIGVILTSEEVEGSPAAFPAGAAAAEAPADPCGDCRRCIDACPGKALTPQGLDARRCYSYLTIENKGPRPSIHTPYWFGCDICQKICPRNVANPTPPRHPEFQPRDPILHLTPEAILQMSEEDFTTRYARSPLSRAGLDGLKQNVLACTRH